MVRLGWIACWAAAIGVIGCGGQTVDETLGGGGSSGSGGSGGGGGSGGIPTTGCSLQVVQAGSLTGAASFNARFAGPGMTATSNGFALGYREQSDAGDFTLRLILIRDDGSSSASSRMATGCAKPAPSDGVGISANSSLGTLVASLEDCGDGMGAGALIGLFHDTNGLETVAVPKNPNFVGLTLTSNSLAPISGSNRFYFVYRAQDYTSEPSGELAAIDDGMISVDPMPAEIFPDAQFISIAASDQVLAMVASQSGALVFELLAPGDPPALLGEQKLGPAPWATIAASGPFAMIVAPADLGIGALAVAATPGGMQTIASGYIENPGPTSGALAIHRDSPVIAFGTPQSVRVQRYGGFGGEPIVATQIPAGAFQGTQIAIAAARQRIAVAWLNGTTSAAGESPGGWALLQCAE